MTTNNEEVAAPEDKAPETNQENEVQVSPVEAAARESGWVTKDEWVAQGKSPDEWRTAREFQERGELFEEIHKLKDANKKTTAAFKVLVEHHKKVREVAINEAIAKLKAEKKAALENHEIDRVLVIDDEIERVKSTPATVPDVDLPEPEVGPTPVFKKWYKRNDWYDLEGKDEASAFANAVGQRIRDSEPNLSEEEFLEKVESKVARRFPELFENVRSNGVSEVNPRSGPKNTSDGVFKMTEAEETVCKMLVASGDMTRAQYIAELKKTRG